MFSLKSIEQLFNVEEQRPWYVRGYATCLACDFLCGPMTVDNKVAREARFAKVKKLYDNQMANVTQNRWYETREKFLFL